MCPPLRGFDRCVDFLSPPGQLPPPPDAFAVPRPNAASAVVMMDVLRFFLGREMLFMSMVT